MPTLKYAYDLAFDSATSRTAFVPVAGDVSKVARQFDDNSYWVLRNHSPATWERLEDPGTAVALSTPPMDVRFTTTNALRAKAIGLRGVLASQTTVGGVDAITPGAGYANYVFLRDYYMAALPFPGFFTAAYMRPFVDLVVGTIGGYAISPASPAEHFYGDTPAYRPGPNGNVGYRAVYDSAAYLTLLTGLVFRRGDMTAYTAHKDALVAALGEAPRSNGLLLSEIGNFTCGWGFEDSLPYEGGLGMASALHAVAYRELAYMASVMGDIGTSAIAEQKFLELVRGLKSLRRADNLYMGSSESPTMRHMILSALMVVENLTGDQKTRYSTALAVRDAVLNGKGYLDTFAAVRHLLKPDRRSMELPVGAQNGGWWPGQWVYWVAASCAFAGDTTTANTIMDEVADDLLRQHTSNAGAPWEYMDDAGNYPGASMYSGAACAALEHLDGPAFRGFYTLDVTEPTNLFKDSFDDAGTLTNYTLDGAAWSISSGALRNNGTIGGESALHAGVGANIYDVTMSCEDGARVPCFIMRRVDADNFLWLWFDYHGSLFLFERTGGVDAGRCSHFGAALTPGIEYKFRITISGSNIEVRALNGWKVTISGTMSKLVDGQFGAYTAFGADAPGEVRWHEIVAYDTLDYGESPEGFLIDPGPPAVPFMSDSFLRNDLSGSITLRGPDGKVEASATATGFVKIVTDDPDLH